jgi:hypothetical protein
MNLEQRLGSFFSGAKKTFVAGALALSLGGCLEMGVKTVYVPIYPDSAVQVDSSVDNNLSLTEGEPNLETEAPLKVEDPLLSEVKTEIPPEAKGNTADLPLDLNLQEIGGDSADLPLEATVQAENLRYLDSCKDSGWEDGMTYVLKGNIAEKLGPGKVCFYLEKVKKVVIDGNGYELKLSPSLTPPSPTIYGIFVKNSQNVRIQNLSVYAENGIGISLMGLDEGRLNDVVIEGNTVGIIIGNWFFQDKTKKIDPTKQILIDKVSCVNNYAEGILIYPDAEQVKISNSFFSGNDYGLSLYGSLQDAIISDSTFKDHKSTALVDNGNSTCLKNLLVIDNNIGLALSGSQTVIEGVSSCNNKLDIDCGSSNLSFKVTNLKASKIGPKCENEGINYTTCGSP